MVIEVMVTAVDPVTPFSVADTVTALFEDFLVRRMPLLFTMAYRAALECHETPESTSCEPSLKVPIAVSRTFECGGTIGFDGVMLMDTSVAVVTVNVADPITPPSDAEIVVTPALNPVANPPALISAELALDELQTTWDVRSSVLLSEKTPVAVY